MGTFFPARQNALLIVSVEDADLFSELKIPKGAIHLKTLSGEKNGDVGGFFQLLYVPIREAKKLGFTNIETGRLLQLEMNAAANVAAEAAREAEIEASRLITEAHNRGWAWVQSHPAQCAELEDAEERRGCEMTVASGAAATRQTAAQNSEDEGYVSATGDVEAITVDTPAPDLAADEAAASFDDSAGSDDSSSTAASRELATAQADAAAARRELADAKASAERQSNNAAAAKERADAQAARAELARLNAVPAKLPPDFTCLRRWSEAEVGRKAMDVCMFSRLVVHEGNLQQAWQGSGLQNSFFSWVAERNATCGLVKDCLIEATIKKILSIDESYCTDNPGYCSAPSGR